MHISIQLTFGTGKSGPMVRPSHPVVKNCIYRCPVVKNRVRWPCLFPSPPALCRYLLPLRVLSVQQVRFLFSTYVWCSCSLSFPIFLHNILQNTYYLYTYIPVSFVQSFIFPFLFVSFFLFLYRLAFVWLCFLVPGTLAFHLPYLDKVRLFGFVGCRHEHDDYDPSYIRELHMLVWDSCIRCEGTVWPDASRHDLP